MKTSNANPLIRLYLLVPLLILMCAPWAQAQTSINLPFYDPFNYSGIGLNLGASGATGSSTTWGNGRASTTITAGSLSYPALLASSGNKVTVNGGSNTCDDNGPRPKFASSVSSGALYFSFLLRVNSITGITGLPDPGRCVVALTGGGGTSVAMTVSIEDDGIGNAKLGVVKWANSNLSPSGPGAYFSSPISTDGSTTYFVVAKYQYVDNNGSNACTVWLNPSSAYFCGPNEDPGNKVVVDNTGAGTDLTTSLQRLYIREGYFADIDELRIGRNWIDVTPGSCCPVAILTPPADATNGIGTVASFSVTSGGTSPHYQWRRDGTNLVNAGNISGVTSARLVIDPVSASDAVPQAHGYDVVVNNTCGSGSTQTSTPRAALTTFTGADLTWKGDGAANEWDVSITANWNNNTAWFTNSDNVTFDDSSVNTTVSVVGSPAPLRVFANAATDYFLNGAIANPAFLIKTNTGRLELAPGSTFKGKTTVKKGTLALDSETSLGSNPDFFKADQLTLDGGSLEAVISLTMDDVNRGITLGLSGATMTVDPGQTLTMKCTIAGPVGAGLVQTGDGTLKMQSFNNYSGNTTVSSGIMYLDNTSATPFGNGAGTFFLAGGTLTVESRGDASLDILNPVVVSADSVITTTQTGKSTVDFRIHNDNACLSGNNKLTLRDDTGLGFGHTLFVRLYGSNLTYNGTVDMVSPAGETIQLASNNQGGTHTFNGVISGPGIFMRRRDTAPGGNTILNALNTYGGGTALMQGGLGLGISSTGPANAPTAGPIGTNTLTVSGSAANLFASGGARNVGNPITLAGTFVIAGANDLTLSGNVDLGGLTRTIEVDNTGLTILSGSVDNGSVDKTGNGTLLLNGAVTADPVLVDAGTLGGTGTLAGTLTVNTNGTLSPGASIGTLTVNNAVTLSGNTFIEVNKTAGTHDLLTGVTTLTYGGTLTATNLSGTLTSSDSFTIFSATTPDGNFSSIVGYPGPGLTWKFDPTTGVLGVAATASTPTSISYSVSDSTLNLTWPADHLGWLVSSNSVDITNPSLWFDIPGSGSATSLAVALDGSKSKVFYRLHRP